MIVDNHTVDNVYGSSQAQVRRMVDPKIFFANERTYLAWMKAGVMLSSIAIGVLVFAQDSGYSPAYGLVLLPIAIGFLVYAIRLYRVCCTIKACFLFLLNFFSVADKKIEKS